MGERTGLLRAFLSAVADTLYETCGKLLTRTSGVYSASSGTLTVESTHRWASAGRIAVAGFTGTYTAKTGTTFTGLVDDASGGTGFPEDISSGNVVMDIDRNATTMDDLYRSFLTGSAVEDQLTTLGRNFGVPRLRGLDDDTYRALLLVMIYLDATTIYACEKVLDALLGVGNYTLYEDLESDPLTVHVVIAAVASTVYAGKAFLVGGEAQARSTVTTVVVDYAPVLVYGVWNSADPWRVGTNYVNTSLATCFTNSAQPTYLQAVSSTFVAADEGGYCLIGSANWKVRAYIDPVTLKLGLGPYYDATLNAGAPTEIRISTDRFRSWMVGHEVVLSGNSAGNSGAYVIASVSSPYVAVLTGAAFVTETDVRWEIRPKFATVNPVTAIMNRATVAAKTITTPVTMSATVLVDYATIPSAELMESPAEDGSAPHYPFYLFDEGYLVQALLDLITAAGVRVVVESE